MKVFFTTLVMLYLCLDVGDPNLPGAISFDLDESVEVVQFSRDPSPAPPVLAVTPEPLGERAPVRISAEVVRRHAGRGSGVDAIVFHVARRLAPDPSGPEEA